MTETTRGRIIYARSFPYGAPLVMLRGGATRDPDVKAYLREQGFRWEGGGRPSHAYESYMYGKELTEVLTHLADMGCEILAKTEDMTVDAFPKVKT